MPGVCLACDFCTTSVDEPYCRRLMRWGPKTARLGDCPITAVPPHGDLIDRDKLRETMFIGEQCLYSWDEIEDAIDFASTIIPADKEATP